MSAASPDSPESDEGLGPLSAHTLSLLSARRPSLAISSGPLSSFQFPGVNTARNADVFRAPQDDSPIGRPDFSRGLQIKMQGWVGDGVGKMSISPSGRDVALSTRSGLYIIDLETPLEVPRFLPQGGTWDVADVQWNPHPSRANYVVSTSSEKLIIWNLDRPDRAAIQLILSRHYRSITDLNWHNHNPDIVASTGIDSWIWMWDLRTAVRPVTGLCAFNPGATQVKWNRHDENILASSHGSTLLIWDQRKGAVPLTTIKAHIARIYGIDWSRRDKNEIVSCSLDQTIKFWNTSPSGAGMGDAVPRPFIDLPTHVPRKQIDTNYPVWRARHVPFGDGVLSLPQRGLKCLELFYQDGQKPIQIMTESGAGAGQSDIVKEYVWRTKGGSDMLFDDREFQLVTWSEDRTLRAWSIDAGILEAAGFNSGGKIEDPTHRFATKYDSYRTPPAVPRVTEHIVSAPTGGRGILAGVRASTNILSKGGDPQELGTISRRSKGAGAGIETFRRGGTMTKGTDKSKRPGMHALAWMPSVTVGEKRDGSGADSLASSRLSFEHPTLTSGTKDRGSESPQPHPGNTSEVFESEATPSWAEELTSVVNSLSSSKMAKVSLDKMELKKRTCTLGLQGPWGESSSVFIRVTFVFPRDYPRSSASQNLPQIELEKNHLIPVKNRTFLLRELRELRKKPPCLEACLRFLLGLPNKKGIYGRSVDTDSGSSSGEDIGSDGRPNRDPSVTMRGQTGLAEPRTSQGVFGPNGELICFSHMPLRMMRTMGRSISFSPSTTSRAPRNSSRNNRSSGVLSDALRRLTAVAHDRQSAPPGATSADEDLLRMLESLAQPKSQQPISDTPQSADVLDSAFYLRPTRKSVVSIRDVSDFAGMDQAIAKEYAVFSNDAGSFCQYNSRIAHAYGRYDHERVFQILYALVGDPRSPSALSAQEMFTTLQWHGNCTGRGIIFSVVEELSQKKDILMLAMVSVALLLSEKMAKTMRQRAGPEPPSMTGRSNIPAIPGHYFVPNKSAQQRARKLSNASFTSQQSLQSPTTSGPAASLSSSASSRGSWSSLLNASASGVRFLMSGQEGSSTPKAPNSPVERSWALPVVSDAPPRVEGSSFAPKIPDSVSLLHGTQRQAGTPKSRSEPIIAPLSTTSRITLSFASAGHLDANESVNSWPLIQRKHVIMGLKANFSDDHMPRRMCERAEAMNLRLVEHIVAYSEFLFRWDLLHKRAELLKCLTKDHASAIRRGLRPTDELVIAPICARCGAEVGSGIGATCMSCKFKYQNPSCSVCRLPANGLSHACLVCRHTTHLRCWNSRKAQFCPTGCGCDCPLRRGSDVERQIPRSPLIPPSRAASSATLG